MKLVLTTDAIGWPLELLDSIAIPDEEGSTTVGWTLPGLRTMSPGWPWKLKLVASTATGGSATPRDAPTRKFRDRSAVRTRRERLELSATRRSSVASFESRPVVSNDLCSSVVAPET